MLVTYWRPCGSGWRLRLWTREDTVDGEGVRTDAGCGAAQTRGDGRPTCAAHHRQKGATGGEEPQTERTRTRCLFVDPKIST